MFWGLQKMWEFFWVAKNCSYFLGIVSTFQQLKSTITFTVGVGTFFEYAEDIGIFWGRQMLKLGFFGV